MKYALILIGVGALAQPLVGCERNNNLDAADSGAQGTLISAPQSQRGAGNNAPVNSPTGATGMGGTGTGMGGTGMGGAGSGGTGFLTPDAGRFGAGGSGAH